MTLSDQNLMAGATAPQPTAAEPVIDLTEPIRFLDLAADHAEIRSVLDMAWDDVVSTGAFIGGQAVDTFEAAFAGYQGAEYCVGVANGTDALELILAGLGVGPGDEVIVPANTFIATAEAVAHVGADIVFADVDPETFLITGEAIDDVITERTRAVMAVHLYGQMVDLDDMAAVVERHGVHIIEDAAQAHGASWNGVRAGGSASPSVAAAFSFYPGKNLGALGDGGAVLTDDADLAERVRSMANHGRSATSKYEHDLLGRNSRLDALQARALTIKLDRLDEWNAARRQVAAWYRQYLPAGVVPLVVRPECEAVHHLGLVQVPDGRRDEIGALLDDAGIGWGIHYPVPCHQQVPFAGRKPVSMPVTEAAAPRILSLPMHPHLREADIRRISEVLRGHPGLA